MLTSPAVARIFHVAKIKLRGLCNQPSRDNSNNNNCNCKTPQMKQKKQKQLRPNRSWNRCLRDQTNDSIWGSINSEKDKNQTKNEQRTSEKGLSSSECNLCGDTPHQVQSQCAAEVVVALELIARFWFGIYRCVYLYWDVLHIATLMEYYLHIHIW